MKKLIRRAGGFLLRGLQGICFYRRVARRLGTGIDIEEASAEEKKAAQALFNFDGPKMPEFNDPNVTDFVAKRRGKVVGFVQMLRRVGGKRIPGRYGLFSLMVKPFYRGMGIGEKLSLRVMEEAKREGARELILFVSEKDRRAISLYEKMGFETVALEEFERELEREKITLGHRRITMRLHPLTGPCTHPCGRSGKRLE